MALQKLHEKHSMDFPIAYWRINKITGTKNGMNIEVLVFPYQAISDTHYERTEAGDRSASELILDKKTYSFDLSTADVVVPSSITVLNFGYLLLKTLPEFDGAEDA